MGKTKLGETYIFKSALKCDSFDVAIGTKIPFFKVLVTIEPGRSLLQFVTTNCLMTRYLVRGHALPYHFRKRWFVFLKFWRI